MKKTLILLIAILILTGCESKNKDENSNMNLSSNSNTNSNSNSNNNDETEQFNKENEGKYKVNLYLFHSNSCSHCQEEKAWLKTIEKDYKYLNIHYYEVSENEALYKKVKEVYDITSTGVPLTIINNDYYLGFSSSKERKFSRLIKEASTEDFCDVVSAIIKNEDYLACKKKNER